MGIKKSIRKIEHEFDVKVEKVFRKHPLFGFLSIFFGIPVFVLACVCISTVGIAFLMEGLAGWF